MRSKSGPQSSAEAHVRKMPRQTRKRYSTEEKIRIVLEGLRGEHSIALLAQENANGSSEPVQLAWTPPNQRRRRSMTVPHGAHEPSAPPSGSCIRAESRAQLLTATAIRRVWLDQLVQGDVPDLAAIATRENRSERSVRMILSLAFSRRISSRQQSSGHCPAAPAFRP